MSVSYAAEDLFGNLHDYHTTVCYAPWYFRLPELASMVVRVPQDRCEWITGTFGVDRNHFTNAEQDRYLRLICRMLQLPPSVDPQVDSSVAWSFVDYKGEPVLRVLIDTTRVPQMAGLILLNALRYLYEDRMHVVSSEFLNIAFSNDEPHALFNTFARAHVVAKEDGVMKNIGHNLYQHFRTFAPGITKTRYEEIITMQDVDFETRYNVGPPAAARTDYAMRDRLAGK